MITITTVIPKTTSISGRGTTVFVTETTSTPSPTIIQDPTQEPPPGTHIDSNNEEGLKVWQTILIVAACLVVAMAIAAVFVVGRIKKRRQRLRQRESMNFMISGDGFASTAPGNANMGGGGGGGACESVQGSEFADSIEKSNRALIGQSMYGHAMDGRQKRLSSWFQRFKRPWSTVRNSQYYNNGSPGGLWLIEDSRENPSYEESITAAAALYPVSYQNDPASFTPPNSGMVQQYHQQYQQQQQQQQHHHPQYLPYFGTSTGLEEVFTASAMEPHVPQMIEDHYPNHMQQEDIISYTTGATMSPSFVGDNGEGGSNTRHRIPLSTTSISSPITSASWTRPSSGVDSASSPNMLRLSVSTDYVDGHGYGNFSPSQSTGRQTNQDQDSLAFTSHGESHDWTRTVVGESNDDTGNNNDGATFEDHQPVVRTAMMAVDPDQLESNAIFEHIRKDPQTLVDAPSENAENSSRSEQSTGSSSRTKQGSK
ncbi:hypothetical protein BGZ65_005074 [Modicella reniformis]|uniref:Uncharacterized protein n=1 Tax=Modicella reniformis TaxID=1440133 RepID=A0A9P6SLZ3_9FUNG|nr:hypothetical protein BGZ65_005074 [Modicella reniformis]